MAFNTSRVSYMHLVLAIECIQIACSKGYNKLILHHLNSISFNIVILTLLLQYNKVQFGQQHVKGTKNVPLN